MSSSIDAGLKGWQAASKATTPASLKRTFAEAVELREAGNAQFRTGNLVLALDLYSSSLAAEETVESLTNRALVLIKLGDLEAAVADCTRALQLDACNIKALARRGTARSGLGLHSAALADFAEAEQREPHNKALRREREREEALVLANAAMGGGGEEDVPLPPLPASTTTTAAAPPPPPLLNDRVLHCALAALDASVALPAELPRSGFAFAGLWRELRGKHELRRELLAARMQQQDYAQCFQRGIEPDLLQDMLVCLMMQQEDDALWRVVQWLSQLDSFALAKMMLPRALRDQVVQRDARLAAVLV